MTEFRRKVAPRRNERARIASPIGILAPHRGRIMSAMAVRDQVGRLRWTGVVPVLAAVVLVATWGSKPAAAVLTLVGVLLAASVLAAVHHAEVVAHRVGEPFGSLVLAVAVTVIEVALIVTLMIAGGPDASTLARDTVSPR